MMIYFCYAYVATLTIVWNCSNMHWCIKFTFCFAGINNKAVKILCLCMLQRNGHLSILLLTLIKFWHIFRAILCSLTVCIVFFYRNDGFFFFFCKQEMMDFKKHFFIYFVGSLRSMYNRQIGSDLIFLYFNQWYDTIRLLLTRWAGRNTENQSFHDTKNDKYRLRSFFFFFKVSNFKKD